MKKILSIIILLTILSGFIVNNTQATNKKYFRVTAYYSPVKGQKYYIKGNYEAEIRMNGKGIKGASGKRVFSGMLAAPSKYKFGTKIYLKGLGVGEVSDRGGAIVHAGERKFKYDRIDIWVGYGDEGLRRAMYWGNRVVEGYITNRNSKITINYKNILAPHWAIPKTKQNPKINYLVKKYNKKIIKSEFEINLEKELKFFNKKITNSKETKKLQEILKKLGLYNGEIDGNYNKIVNIISKYQLEKKLIKKISEAGTGYFGPKTRASLKKDYKNFLIKQKQEKEKQEKYKKQIQKLKIISEKKAKELLRKIGNPKFGEISSGTRELQKTLKKLGFFNYKDTAIFGPKTKKAITNYQINRQIIANKYIPAAGYFGPATKKQLLSDLANIFLIEEIQKNDDLYNYYKNKKGNLN